MSKLTVTTIAGVTSGADANKVKIESGHTLESENVTVSGASTFEKSISVGTTANLISNGDFTTNTTGWAATGSTLAISSGALQITPGSGVNGFANQQVDNLVIGRSYIASVVVTQDAGNYSRLYIGTSANGNQNVTSSNLGTGSHSFTFVATATTHHFALVVGGGTGQVTKFDAARLTEASRIIFPAVTGIAPEIKQGTTVNDFAIATNQVNRLNIDANGQVTMPSQPAFSTAMSGNQAALSPGVNTTMTFNTEHFDQNGDYNTSNYTFTAPIDGRYQFNAIVYMNAVDIDMTYYQMYINTSNRIFYNILDPRSFDQDPAYHGISMSVLAAMDAGDTAICTMQLGTGGATQTTVYMQSSFSGYLVC